MPRFEEVRRRSVGAMYVLYDTAGNNYVTSPGIHSLIGISDKRPIGPALRAMSRLSNPYVEAAEATRRRNAEVLNTEVEVLKGRRVDFTIADDPLTAEIIDEIKRHQEEQIKNIWYGHLNIY